MALLSAYATVDEYKSRNGKISSAQDSELDGLLTTVSRMLERRTGMMPGAFNSHTPATYVFDGRGGRILRLRDRAGRQYFLQTITADSLKLDTDLDGSYDDYLWDLSDAWVRGLPENAAALSEPYTALELRPVSTAPLTSWPNYPGSIQIVGTFGWAAVPGAVKERVIGITRELIETHRAGPTLTVQEVDQAIELNPGARSLMHMLEREYSHRLPAIA